MYLQSKFLFSNASLKDVLTIFFEFFFQIVKRLQSRFLCLPSTFLSTFKYFQHVRIHTISKPGS